MSSLNLTSLPRWRSVRCDILTPMNHWHGYAPIAFAWAVFAGFAVVSFAQAPAKTAPLSSAKQDTWERSKECAAQAEKMVAGWSQRAGSAPTDWNNHYSPKYNKCFVSITSVQLSTDEKTFPTLHSTALFNAFERSPSIAAYCTVLGHDDCVQYLNSFQRSASLDAISRKLNGKTFAEANAAEQQAALDAESKVESKPTAPKYSFCEIDGKPTDCAKAEAFIAEHMKD
jgi:hypothetical protein